MKNIKNLILMLFINFFVFSNLVVFSMFDNEEHMNALVDGNKPSSSRKKSQISLGASTSQELSTKRTCKRYAIAQEGDCYSRLKAAESLFKSDNENDQEIGRIALRSITQKEDCCGGSPCLYEEKAATSLFKSDNQEDKRIGRDRLIRVAKNEQNMLGVDAAKFLFVNEDDENVRNIARSTLYSIIQYPQWYYQANGKEVYTDQLVLQLNIAKILIEKGNEEDKNRGEQAIQCAYDNACRLKSSKYLKSLQLIHGRLGDDHPIRFSALKDLLCCGNIERYAFESRVRRNDARERLCKIAEEEGHPHQYNAAKLLYDRGEYDRAREILSSIAKQKDHPNQAEASKTLESEKCLIL